MSDHEHISLDGTLYRVVSCTERHGVWVEKFWPKRADHHKDPLTRAIDAAFPSTRDEDEPDDCTFIPGDIKDAIARSIIATACEVSIEEDPDMPEADPC